jgi:peptide deformylase
MARLTLIIAPDPILNQVSEYVPDVNDDIRKFMDDMLETMYAENGGGLAAVQVGVLKRILIFDPTTYIQREHEPIFMVNPEITYFSDQKCTRKEGCLSFPGSPVEITRPENVKVKFLDYYGKEQEFLADGWVATGIQHEIDHLNGITQLDYVSKMKKDFILKKLAKYKKLYHK